METAFTQDTFPVRHNICNMKATREWDDLFIIDGDVTYDLTILSFLFRMSGSEIERLHFV